MCPKCKAKIFKPFEGGKCCVYCGTLVLDPLEVAKVIDHKIRDYQRFPDVPYEPKPFDSNNSNTARAIRARAYILTVFEYIQNELWRLKSWHESGTAEREM
jgi:hypothetical protein